MKGSIKLRELDEFDEYGHLDMTAANEIILARLKEWGLWFDYDADEVHFDSDNFAEIDLYLALGHHDSESGNHILTDEVYVQMYGDDGFLGDGNRYCGDYCDYNFSYLEAVVDALRNFIDGKKPEKRDEFWGHVNDDPED